MSSPVNPSSPSHDVTSPVTRTSTEANPVENQTYQVVTGRLSGDHTPVESPKMDNRGTTVINNVSEEEAAVSDDAKKSVATTEDVSEAARIEFESSQPEDLAPANVRQRWKEREAEAKKEKEAELNRSRSKSDPAAVASPKPLAKESLIEEQPVVEDYPEAAASPSPKEAPAPAAKESPAPAVNVENKSPVTTEEPASSEPTTAETEEPKTTSLVDAAKSKIKSCDWYNIATIVAGVVFALFAVFGALCAGGIFPMAFLGGQLGVGFSVVGGVLLMAAAGAVYYYRRESQKMQTAQEA